MDAIQHDWVMFFRAALTGGAIVETDSDDDDPVATVGMVTRAARIADLAVEIVRLKDNAARTPVTLPSLSPTKFEDVSSSAHELEEITHGKGRD